MGKRRKTKSEPTTRVNDAARFGHKLSQAIIGDLDGADRAALTYVRFTERYHAIQIELDTAINAAFEDSKHNRFKREWDNFTRQCDEIAKAFKNKDIIINWQSFTELFEIPMTAADAYESRPQFNTILNEIGEKITGELQDSFHKNIGFIKGNIVSGYVPGSEKILGKPVMLGKKQRQHLDLNGNVIEPVMKLLKKTDNGYDDVSITMHIVGDDPTKIENICFTEQNISASTRQDVWRNDSFYPSEPYCTYLEKTSADKNSEKSYEKHVYFQEAKDTNGSIICDKDGKPILQEIDLNNIERESAIERWARFAEVREQQLLAKQRTESANVEPRSR